MAILTYKTNLHWLKKILSSDMLSHCKQITKFCFFTEFNHNAILNKRLKQKKTKYEKPTNACSKILLENTIFFHFILFLCKFLLLVCFYLVLLLIKEKCILLSFISFSCKQIKHNSHKNIVRNSLVTKNIMSKHFYYVLLLALFCFYL